MAPKDTTARTTEISWAWVTAMTSTGLPAARIRRSISRPDMSGR